MCGALAQFTEVNPRGAIFQLRVTCGKNELITDYRQFESNKAQTLIRDDSLVYEADKDKSWIAAFTRFFKSDDTCSCEAW